MTSYKRTQVYLDPDDHRQMQRLAAERDRSLTDLVREAVARYVADELADELPSMSDMLDELYAGTSYEGLEAGPDGFVARMRVRALAQDGDGDSDSNAGDRDIGAALVREHDAQRDAWRRRRALGTGGATE